MPEPDLIQQVVVEIERSGVDLRAMGLGWARAAPVVAVVPAFGLRALPGPVRAVMALALAACAAPALRAAPGVSAPWGWDLAESAMRGIPVALAAAIPLWAATMAGGAVDAVRGANDGSPIPVIEGRPTPIGVPMALLAAIAFLGSGGPSRVVSALARAPVVDAGTATRVAFDLAAGIEIAIAIAAPVLAASVVVELASALTARAAVPAQLHVLLAPLRSFALLAVASLVLDRMTGLINVMIAAGATP